MHDLRCPIGYSVVRHVAAYCGTVGIVVAKTTQNAARSRIRCEYSVEESHDSIIRYEGLVVELRVTS